MTTDPSAPLPDDPRIPPMLGSELTRLAGTPAGLDRFNAAAAATAHLSRARRRQRLRWASVAAASLMLGAFIAIQPFGSPRPSMAHALPGDLNADGKVDMLDALFLARSVDTGRTNPSWDFNHDAKVDRLDADTIARAAVDLKGGRL